jgi:40S ribosome biogenesis protein Tsr1 and BMS1 C-terminal
VVGGLASGESALGFVRARIKRHRWHKRVLKSNNPIIFSVSTYVQCVCVCVCVCLYVCVVFVNFY